MTEERQDSAPVVVGRVLRPHGVRGALLVEPLSDNPRRFAPGSHLTARREGGGGAPVEVTAARPHGRALLVELAGLADRDAAEALRGSWLEVPAAAVPPAPEGSYYFFELVGCRCHDRQAGDLGEVADVIEDGGGLLLLLERPGARLLVPFVERFVLRIDRAARRIELALPPGLVETCTSPS
ncbi:MAG: 16S rRNA processing protein RimM [Thermoanaerobaculia bacterium]|nr:16S rRNA processing protein RimM [Thermoanaerobaculia bacterium]